MLRYHVQITFPICPVPPPQMWEVLGVRPLVGKVTSSVENLLQFGNRPVRPHARIHSCISAGKKKKNKQNIDLSLLYWLFCHNDYIYFDNVCRGF